MSLRLKLILGVILIIFSTFMLSTIGVGYLVGKQNDEYSRTLVIKAWHLVQNALGFMQENAMAQVKRFASDPANIASMRYLDSMKNRSDIGSYRFILERPKEEMVSTLYGMIRAGSFDGFYVYDKSGELIISLQRINDQVKASIQSLDSNAKPIFKHNIYEKNLESGWIEGDFPSNDWSAISEQYYSFADDTWFQVVNGNLALIGVADIKFSDASQEENSSAGHVIFYKILDQTFSERLHIETQVDVNIFAGERLTQGTLNEFKSLPRNFMNAEIEEPGIVVNTFNRESYYQTFIRLNSPENHEGTIVLSLSRSETIRKTRQNILMLLSITGLSLSVAIPITVYMAARLSLKIHAILSTVNQITSGNRSARVRVTSKDELGQLAEAFNQMTDDLDKSIHLLQETAQKYQNLFNSAPDGITITTLPGEILSFNETFMKMFEFEDPSEIVEMRITDLYYHEAERNKFLDRIERDGKVDKLEVRFKTRQGKQFIGSISSRKVIYENKTAYQTIFRDITAHKQAEEEIWRLNRELEQRVAERTAQLEAATEQTKELLRRAESANISKSQFLANMSHEIRTPMNGIIGACDLLQGTNLERKQKEYLNIIRTSARSLLGLINDILDFSKIEAGKLDFMNTPFSLRALIEEVCDMFYENMSKKRTELVVDLDPEIPRQIISDPLRLRQVLVNLMSNAFKFTENGEICITVQCKNKNTDSVEILFCVRDTGIGIPYEIQPRLFDAFMQADGSMTRKYGGTGLGLAICKRIVNMMNGKIWAESEPGRGSSFYFLIRFKFIAEEIEQNNGMPPELKHLRVLLVEDNPAAQLVIKRFLDSFGFRSEAVETGEAALELYEKEAETSDPFGLILIDYHLPGIDGIHTSEMIKKNERFNAPPIILISGYIMEDGIRRFKDAGIESYLVKPVKRSLLFDTIMEIFGAKTRTLESPADSSAVSTEFSNLDVLLVEDNPTNRRVGKEILESSGIKVDTASSGIEAIEAVKAKRYDAVFMDIQMPEMDGLEATRRIRDWEKLSRSSLPLPKTELPSPVPIIAMTAHAMSGDREKCLDAGMNDYVPKPIDRKELFAVLRRIFKPSELTDESTIQNEQLTTSGAGSQDSEWEGSPLPGLNVAEALKRLGGLMEVYRDIVHNFCTDHQQFPQKMQAYIRQKDFDKAVIAAHSLKGAAGNISAEDLKAAAKRLEEACLHQKEDDIPELLLLIKNLLAQLRESSAKLSSVMSSGNQRMKEGDYQPENRSKESEIGRVDNMDVIRSLEKSLSDADPIQSAYWIEELQKRHSGADDLWITLLNDLERSILDYDFETAKKILTQLCV